MSRRAATETLRDSIAHAATFVGEEPDVEGFVSLIRMAESWLDKLHGLLEGKGTPQ